MPKKGAEEKRWERQKSKIPKLPKYLKKDGKE
jgi:hypothetical protein